jgi:hypothetical protein
MLSADQIFHMSFDITTVPTFVEQHQALGNNSIPGLINSSCKTTKH